MTGIETALILAAASTAVSTFGAIKSAQAQAEASEYNAKVAEMQAKAEEDRIRRQTARKIGAIRSGIAKSGVTTQGTPLLVLAESAELAELDALNARWSGETDARLDRMRARSARQSIPYTVGAGLLSAGSAYAGMSAGASSGSGWAGGSQASNRMVP